MFVLIFRPMFTLGGVDYYDSDPDYTVTQNILDPKLRKSGRLFPSYLYRVISSYFTMMILPHVGLDFVATVHPGVGCYDADPDGGGHPHDGGFDGVGGGGGDYPQGGMDSSV